MESRTKLFGHPVHPMLVVFPLGLLGTAMVFDIIRLATGNDAGRSDSLSADVWQRLHSVMESVA